MKHSGPPVIAAVILAAGSSARMGTPKALLAIEDRTFIEHLVAVLAAADVHDIVAVLGNSAELIQEKIPRPPARIVINSSWGEGQLSSITAGLEALAETPFDGVLVCPVDHPHISTSLIRLLIQSFERTGKGIIIPTYKGKRGHPVLFSRAISSQCATASRDVGARAVVHQNPGEILEVPTEEAGVLLDIDTPEDYAAAVQNTKGTNA